MSHRDLGVPQQELGAVAGVILYDLHGMVPLHECIGCGCDDQHACVRDDALLAFGGELLAKANVEHRCSWVAPGLCSFCAVVAEALYLQSTGRG